jgi:NTP pyrophosphatase (non-canonical NTP hydrolase)
MDISLNEYTDFVAKVTSDPSNELEKMSARLDELNSDDVKVNMSLLLTGGIGLSSETGEFNEIIKKMIFQGKPWNEDTKFHLKRELGDVIFYWVNACRALNLDPNEVIQENVNKLSARYPSGFEVFRSENRKKTDI